MDGSLRRRLDRLAVGAVLATLAVGLAAWSQLPAEVAIHFSAAGTPDTDVPKTVGVLVVPATALLTAGVLRASFRVDPPADPQVPVVVTAATYALLLGAQLLVVGWNLGHPVPFAAVWGAIGLWTVALLGYVLAVERRR